MLPGRGERARRGARGTWGWIFRAAFRSLAAKDRVGTIFAPWLGLTTGCADRHDHKLDPISQHHFYRMTAFSRNTTQSALDHGQPDKLTVNYQGLNQKLVGVDQPAHVVTGILA